LFYLPQVPASEKEAAEVKFQSIKEAYDSLKNTKHSKAFDLHGLEGLRCQKDKICAAPDNALWSNDAPSMLGFYGITALIAGFYVTSRQAATIDCLIIPTMYAGVLTLEFCFRGYNDSVKDFDIPPALAQYSLFNGLTRYDKAIVGRYLMVWYVFSGVVQVAYTLIGNALTQTKAAPTASSAQKEALLAKDFGNDTAGQGGAAYFQAMMKQQQQLISRLEQQAEAINKKR